MPHHLLKSFANRKYVYFGSKAASCSCQLLKADYGKRVVCVCVCTVSAHTRKPTHKKRETERAKDTWDKITELGYIEAPHTMANRKY